MDLGLTGKVAMVGGASRGLGFAVARVLLLEGAKVSIASSSLEGITAAAQKLRSEIDPSRATDVLEEQADLRSAEAIERWFERTRGRFDGVDLLFVNTGGPPAGAAMSFDDDAWKNAFDLLVMSAVRQIRLAVPSMAKRGGGSIVVSTSSSVKEPIQNLALSNVLRASVGALAKIRVNHLLPGRIDTDRVRQLDAGRAKTAGVSVEEQKTRTEKTIPLGRYGDAEEFGKAAAFLLSDASAYTTGASLQVDGGMIRGVL
jgi:3-oxoacyl-[acyl-carrier protein] reductase